MHTLQLDNPDSGCSSNAEHPLGNHPNSLEGISYLNNNNNIIIKINPGNNLRGVTKRKRGNNNLNFVYFNARSLVNKYDELYAVTEVSNPDVIHSWMQTYLIQKLP